MVLLLSSDSRASDSISPGREHYHMLTPSKKTHDVLGSAVLGVWWECRMLPNTFTFTTTSARPRAVRQERGSGNTIIIVRGRAVLLVSKGVQLPAMMIQGIC